MSVRKSVTLEVVGYANGVVTVNPVLLYSRAIFTTGGHFKTSGKNEVVSCYGHERDFTIENNKITFEEFRVKSEADLEDLKAKLQLISEFLNEKISVDEIWTWEI